MTKTPGLTPITTSKQASGTTNNEASQTPKTPSATNELNNAVHKNPNVASDFFRIAVDLSESSGSSDETDVTPPTGSMSVRVGKGDGADFQWNQRTPRAQSAEPRMSTLSIPSSQDIFAARMRSGSATPNSSVTPHTNKEKVAALGYTATSPFARMNNAAFETEFQRNFFLGRAQRHGYALAEIEERHPGGRRPSKPMSGKEKDDALYRQWGATQRAKEKAAKLLNTNKKITESRKKEIEAVTEKATDFFDARAGQTKEEKIAFAFNLARTIMRPKSDRLREAESHSLESVNSRISTLSQTVTRLSSAANTPQIGPVSPNIREMSPDAFDLSGIPSNETFRLNVSNTGFRAADLPLGRSNRRNNASSIMSPSAHSDLQSEITTVTAELSEAQEHGREAKFTVLSDDAIDEGKKFIKDLFLNSEPKGTAPEIDAARVNWSPFNDSKNNNNREADIREVDEIANQFVEICEANNALARARNKAADEQYDALNGAVLPRLGMPITLRSDRKADDIRAKAAEEFSTQKKWGSGNRVWGMFQDLGAVFGTVLGLGFPLLSSSWVNFCKSRWSRSYRVSEVERHANAVQTEALKNLNRNKADLWVGDLAAKEATRGHNDGPPSESLTSLQEAFEEQNYKYTALVNHVNSLPENASAEEVFNAIEKYGYERLRKPLENVAGESVKANFLEEIRTQDRINTTWLQRRTLTNRIAALPDNATKAEILAVIEERGPRRLYDDLKDRPGLSPKDRILAELENLGRKELIEEVATQLEFAQKAEILAERERQAAAEGWRVDDPRIIIPDEEYLLDPRFLYTIAESIVQGIENALPPVENRIPALDMGIYPIASDGAAEADEDQSDG